MPIYVKYKFMGIDNICILKCDALTREYRNKLVAGDYTEYAVNRRCDDFHDLILLNNEISEKQNIPLLRRLCLGSYFENGSLKDIFKYERGDTYYFDDGNTLRQVITNRTYPKNKSSMHSVVTFDIPKAFILEWYRLNPLVCSLYMRDLFRYIIDTLITYNDDIDDFEDDINFFREYDYILTLENIVPEVYPNCKGLYRESGDTWSIEEDKEEKKEKMKRKEKVVDNKKGNMNYSKMFNGMKMGKVDGVVLSMTGSLAIKIGESCYTYDKESNTVTDNMDFSFGEDMGMFYAVPTNKNDIKSGDIIIDKDEYLFVKESDKGVLTVVSPEDNQEVKKVKSKHILGFEMVSKVISLMDASSMGGSSNESGNPFGNMNPMMLMMMNDSESGSESSMSDMLPLMMMQNQNQNGNQNGFNPMMLMMMDKGNGSGNGSSSMKDMMMMSMMMGNNNPFSQNTNSETNKESDKESKE